MPITQAPPASAHETAHTGGKVLNWTLWGAQFLLAIAFGMAGFMKATQPLEQLGAMIPWTRAVPPAMVRLIGTAEFLAGIGILFPALTRILPWLTSLAGVGLTTVMVLAAGFHAMRGEWGTIAPTVVLGLLATFVTWGRFRKAPILPRG